MERMITALVCLAVLAIGSTGFAEGKKAKLGPCVRFCVQALNPALADSGAEDFLISTIEQQDCVNWCKGEYSDGECTARMDGCCNMESNEVDPDCDALPEGYPCYSDGQCAQGLACKPSDVGYNTCQKDVTIINYIQYRDYEYDSTWPYGAREKLVGCLIFSYPNGFIPEEVAPKMSLWDPSGNLVASSDKYLGNEQVHITNCAREKCEASDWYGKNWCFAEYADTGDVEKYTEGMYRYDVDYEDGTFLSVESEYKGRIRLPLVKKDDIKWDWNDDGSLRVYWTNPTDEDTWKHVTEIDIILAPHDDTLRFRDWAVNKVYPQHEETIFPKEVVERFDRYCYDEASNCDYYLQVQLRSYEKVYFMDHENNWARSYSAWTVVDAKP